MPTESDRIAQAKQDARDLGFYLWVEDVPDAQPSPYASFAAPALRGRPSMGAFLAHGASAAEAAEAGVQVLRERQHNDAGEGTITISAPPAKASASAPQPQVIVGEGGIPSEEAFGSPEVKDAVEIASDYGWTIAFTEEPDGTVRAYLLDDSTADVLKTATGSDFHDSVLELMKDTFPPSEEVRREQR